MMNGENSPAFILAREGYDVWLGANRGCKFSQRHQWLNHENEEEDKIQFWDFSLQEMGQYDV